MTPVRHEVGIYMEVSDVHESSYIYFAGLLG